MPVWYEKIISESRSPHSTKSKRSPNRLSSPKPVCGPKTSENAFHARCVGETTISEGSGIFVDKLFIRLGRLNVFLRFSLLRAAGVPPDLLREDLPLCSTGCESDTFVSPLANSNSKDIPRDAILLNGLKFLR